MNGRSLWWKVNTERSGPMVSVVRAPGVKPRGARKCSELHFESLRKWWENRWGETGRGRWRDVTGSLVCHP